MQKKYYIYSLIALLVVAILFVFFYFLKKYQDSSGLYFVLDDFNFTKLENGGKITDVIADFSDGYTEASAKIKIRNHSSSKFIINDLLVKIYAEDETFVASQKNIIKDKIIIKPKSEKTINFVFSVSLAGIYHVAKSKNILQVITNYYANGEFGKQVVLKGYFKTENLNFIKIPLNEKIDF